MTLTALSDFDTICRICLLKKHDMMTIHKTELAEMFNSLTNIKIGRDDGLPHSICADCAAQVRRSYDFKVRCENSDSELRRLLSSISLKIEYSRPTVCDESTEHGDTGPSRPVGHEEIETADERTFDADERSSDDDVPAGTRGRAATTDKRPNGSKIEKIMSMGPDKCDPTNLTCKICDKTLVNIYSLARHMEMHDEDRKFNFMCTVCEKGFYEKGQLTKHARRHGGETRYDCDRCAKSYYELSALSVHMKSYHKAGPISCEVCRKSFYVKRQLEIHSKTHSAKKEHVCNECSKSFHLPCQLKRHELSHKKESMYPCLFCDKIFKYSFNLKKHHESFHVAGRRTKLEKCGVCGKSVKNIKPHMLTHAAAAVFECPECPRAFKDRYRLNHHRKIRHSIDDGDRRPYPYLCATCGKRCASTTKLRVHTRVHTGERPFACDLCDKRFITNAQRGAHVRTHTGERPYVCSVCSRGFHIRNLLTRHMLTHTGEKPHKCDVCLRPFAQRSALKTHMKVH